MRVRVHLLSQSQPIERLVENAYVKDGLYCLYISDAIEDGEQRPKVEKYPLCNIFRVVEDYG